MWLSNGARIFKNGPVVSEPIHYNQTNKHTNKQSFPLYNISVDDLKGGGFDLHSFEAFSVAFLKTFTTIPHTSGLVQFNF